ncbi:retrovirus-related pol polyprotein from transposon TNT 1-94, partial [Tanacetum coccineum]
YIKHRIRNNFVSNQSAPSFDQLFELNELKAQSQEKDTVIEKLKERIKSLSGKMNEDKIKKDLEEIETINIELDHRVSKLIAENEHLKHAYKQLYDSIKPARIRSKEQCDDLINQVNLKSVEISDLKASLQEKVLVITDLKDDLRKLKGKALVYNDVTKHPSYPEMLKIDVEPITLKLLNKKTAHSAYIKHTQEEAAVLKDLVDHVKANYPLDHTLDSAYRYTKLIHDLLTNIGKTCHRINNSREKLVVVTPKNKYKRVRFTEPFTSSGNTITKTASTSNLVSNKPMLSSTGVKQSTSASGSQPSGNTKKDKNWQIPRIAYMQHSKLNANSKLKCVKCNGYMLSDNHDLCVLDFINNVNARNKSKSVKQSRTFTIVGNACPLTRITTTTKVPLRKPTALENEIPKPAVTLVYSRKPRKSKTNVPISKSKVLKCDNHDLDRIGNQSIECDHLNEIGLMVKLVSFMRISRLREVARVTARIALEFAPEFVYVYRLDFVELRLLLFVESTMIQLLSQLGVRRLRNAGGEVDGQTVKEIETKIIAKDGTITRVPRKFQGYETSEEEPFAPHRLPQPKGNMNGWLIEDEEEVDRNEVDSNLESSASSKPVWEKTTKDDHDRASLVEMEMVGTTDALSRHSNLVIPKSMMGKEVRYAASSLVNKALTWWNTQVQARGREAAMAMTWNDFKALMVEEFCPSNEMEKLENEFWNHKMVGANHAAYTDRFHELAKLVPHLVTPESSRIKRYIAGLAPEIRGMLRATQPTTIQNAILRAGILTDEAVSCGTLTKGSDKRKGVEESGKTGGSWKDNKKAKTGTGFVATAPTRNEAVSSNPKRSKCFTYHPVNGFYRLCFNCQKLGHFIKDCRAPIRQVVPVNAVRMNNNPRVCYECGSVRNKSSQDLILPTVLMELVLPVQT